MKKFVIFLLAAAMIFPVIRASEYPATGSTEGVQLTLPPGSASYYGVATFERAGRSLRLVADSKQCKEFVQKHIRFAFTVNGISKREASVVDCKFQYNFILVQDFYLPEPPDYRPK